LRSSSIKTKLNIIKNYTVNLRIQVDDIVDAVTLRMGSELKTNESSFNVRDRVK